MSRAWQQTIIMGNLGKDPELRYTPGGQAICQFSVAVSRSWKKDEEWQEETTWFRVTAWGQAGERAAEKLLKGAFVRVIGRIRTYDWTNKDGAVVHAWELIADRVDSLDRDTTAGYTRGDDAYVDQLAASRPQQQPVAAGLARSTEPIDEPPYDDLPF